MAREYRNDNIALEDAAIEALEAEGYTRATNSIRRAIMRGMGLPCGSYDPETRRGEPTRSFDMIDAPADIDLEDEWDIRRNFHRIRILEVKSKSDMSRCRGLNVTTNEISLANFLGDRYVLVIYDVKTGRQYWDTLAGAMSRAKHFSTTVRFTYNPE